MDISVLADHLKVTPEEIIKLEKGYLFPASSTVTTEIKNILKLEDKDLYSNSEIVLNSKIAELESLIKERNYHLNMAHTIYHEYPEKTYYISTPDGENLPKSLSPAQQAKDYLLSQLKSLTVEELTNLFKYFYQEKIEVLADKI
ncbi:MAG: hypothetical protein HFH41_10395 [Lachnospiraceae bacterium]|nr:hypothetical protein [Lachnospiraceae bacterium]